MEETTCEYCNKENITLKGILTANSGESRSITETIRVSLAIPLVITATWGNVLSFLIMRRKSMKITSPGIYFAAIACMDTMTVYLGLLPFVVYYFSSVDLWTLHPWSCKIVIFMLFTSCDSAVWLILAVTVDRFIAVKYPMNKPQMCTPNRAMIVALALPSIAILKNVHLFYTRGRQVMANPESPEEWTVNNCGFPSPAIEYFETYIRTWIGFSLYAFIPIFSVLALNVLIIHTVWKVRKISAQSSKGEWIKKSNNQLTAMFLSVSITFLIFVIPSITVLVIKPYLNLNDKQLNRYAYIEAIVDSMAHLMHSSNFFLYCLTGPGFRRELILMFNKRLRRSSLYDRSIINNTLSTVSPSIDIAQCSTET